MQLFVNNADSELNGAIATGTLSITLKTGDGAKFPSPTGGDFFLMTLYQKVGATESNHEIIKCTARTGDVLTVVRAQEGTTAKAFNSADPIELRLTAGTLTSKADLASPTFTGTVGGITAAMVGAPAGSGTSTGSNTGDQDLSGKQAVLVSGTNIKTVNSTSLLGSGDVIVGDVTLAGTQSLTNKTIEAGTFTNGYTEEVYAPAAGSAFTVDLANGSIQGFTTNANTTITLPAVVAGKSFQLQIAFGGAHTLTFAGGTLVWGTTPTFSGAASKTDIVNFTANVAGTKWIGAAFAIGSAT